MKKTSLKRSTLLNVKGFLYLTAFAIWVFVIMETSDNITSINDAVFSYGGSTLVVIGVLYIILIVLEFLVDLEDID